MITLFKQFIQNPLLWWSYSSTVMNPLGLSEEGKNNMNSVWKHLKAQPNVPVWLEFCFTTLGKKHRFPLWAEKI